MSGLIGSSVSAALNPPALANGLNVTKYIAGTGAVAPFGTLIENTATTSSPTLTDMVNYTGAGVLEFAFAMTSASVETARMQIIIDGVIVADVTTPAVQWAMLTPVGGIVAVAAANYYAPVLAAVPFSKSLNIKIAAPGSALVNLGARFRKHQ
jgi:hypothetical protein